MNMYSGPLNSLAPIVVGLLLSFFNSALNASQTGDAKPPQTKTTYTYKTVEGIKVEADVYCSKSAVKRPVVVWLHGGALIMGSRTGVPAQLLKLSRQEDYVLVSLDYRLAPEAKLSEIIEDLKDGLNWVRKSGPKLFGADPSKMVVAGASAGGYLAMMSGVVANPPPTALVAYWGFGDIDGDWTTKPNENYRKGVLISREDAWATVGDHVLTHTDRNNAQTRAKFFTYLKQTGLWTKAVSGIDPETDKGKLAAYCPIRNLSSTYPPILMLHGTADTDVPVHQSQNMARELKRLESPHELIIIENGRHSLWGGDRQLIEQAFSRSMQYIREHLSKH